MYKERDRQVFFQQLRQFLEKNGYGQPSPAHSQKAPALPDLPAGGPAGLRPQADSPLMH
ncbi:MAG: hypothetical protein HC860_02315 [Alkalinema sp. RU_4_3]|nr:hypothetical protein [Alkalinema sp. RU_4_3]